MLKIIEDSLIIRFLSPDIMFDPMKSLIKKEFKGILNDFAQDTLNYYTSSEKV